MQESLLLLSSDLAASALYTLSHLEFPKMRFLLERTTVQIDKEWDCFCQPIRLLLSHLACVTFINITFTQSAKVSPRRSTWSVCGGTRHVCHPPKDPKGCPEHMAPAMRS